MPALKLADDCVGLGYGREPCRLPFCCLFSQANSSLIKAWWKLRMAFESRRVLHLAYLVPSKWRGRQATMDYTARYESPLGGITMASDGKALVGLWFDGQKYFGSTLYAEHEQRWLHVFDQTRTWLDAYFAGRDPGFTPPLAFRGSDFRRAVWQVLLTIPYGRTMTYGQIAETLAQKHGLTRTSARAVGGAVGHNPISLIVPCHRVVGANGNLTGYAGGVWRKERLLELENGST